jgi:Zn-dependent metalloprotease
LHDDVKINNVINSNLLLSITGFPNYDNAAFTSKYMIYGDGQTLFNPLEMYGYYRT